MGDEEWVKAAMTDVTMVAELLMRLHQSERYTSPPAKINAAVVPLKWGVRQPRSWKITRYNMVQFKKEDDSTRASPTTPLSWSGGTSFSGAGAGAGDDYEDSSRLTKPSSVGRSKVTATSETTIRRSRKKKTLTELKEEESLLVKERIDLKRELLTLRITFEEQRARNKSLKKMKLDLQLHSAKKGPVSDVAEKALSVQFHHKEVALDDHTPTLLPMSVTCDELVFPSPPSDSRKVQKKDVATLESSFVLPDLNLPTEDDSGSTVLYGMS
ncbi:hypothetical protein HHK36_021327 [Tetracentron sinense]|uniref:Uncharacterized protein n=1 Tax=Tetracentron sinense TaxID=13715 RepID=A0A834YTR7_TETSI|nr:hypothetical protein HHK36_021327 [Tetracentron sinense]